MRVGVKTLPKGKSHASYPKQEATSRGSTTKKHSRNFQRHHQTRDLERCLREELSEWMQGLIDFRRHSTVSCPICGKDFTRRKAQLHAQTHLTGKMSGLVKAGTGFASLPPHVNILHALYDDDVLVGELHGEIWF